MLLIISGHNRSGTTLTQRLCDSHPEIGLTNEFGGLLDIGTDIGTYTRQIIRRWWVTQNRPFFRGDTLWGKWCYGEDISAKRVGSWACLVGKFSRIYMLQNSYFVSRYLLRLHLDQRKWVDVQAIEAALRAIFAGATIVGDNFPDYMFCLEKLIDLNGLCCLIVYRDARDVVSDTLKRLRPRWWQGESRLEYDARPWWPQEYTTAATIAQRWVDSVRIMERVADRVHLVRYEDLVSQPQPVLEALGSWLGVDPSGFRSRMIQRGGSIGVHGEDLHPQELAEVVHVAGPTLEQWGYEI